MHGRSGARFLRSLGSWPLIDPQSWSCMTLSQSMSFSNQILAWLGLQGGIGGGSFVSRCFSITLLSSLFGASSEAYPLSNAQCEMRFVKLKGLLGSSSS